MSERAKEGGLKFDDDKPPMDLLPFDALTLVAKVLGFGRRKYEANSWRGIHESRYEAAMLRHYAAIQRGEVNDPESGLPHTAHLACCALFICALRDGGK